MTDFSIFSLVRKWVAVFEKQRSREVKIEHLISYTFQKFRFVEKLSIVQSIKLEFTK